MKEIQLFLKTESSWQCRCSPYAYCVHGNESFLWETGQFPKTVWKKINLLLVQCVREITYVLGKNLDRVTLVEIIWYFYSILTKIWLWD